MADHEGADMAEASKIREALDSGEASLRYIVTDEAWYGSVVTETRKTGEVCEFSVGIDAGDGGTCGEWSVALYEFQGSPAIQHRVFDDAIEAVQAVPNYWQAMADITTRVELEAALISLGFRDATERQSPKSEASRCECCGAVKSR
jgi:hypothetical protein